MEISELERTEERNLGVEITAKQRDLERTKIILKQISRDRESIKEDLNELVSEIEVLGLYCGWGDDFATDRREWLEDTQRLHMDFPTVLVAHRRDTHRGNILLDKFTREQFSKSFESFPSYFIIDSSGMCTHYQSGGLDFQDNGLRLKNAVKRVV